VKKLISVVAIFIIFASLYYGFSSASKVKKLEQKLADYEKDFNNVVSENENYKSSIDKLESKLLSIENALRSTP
jgi:cell division protein FtsB